MPGTADCPGGHPNGGQDERQQTSTNGHRATRRIGGRGCDRPRGVTVPVAARGASATIAPPGAQGSPTAVVATAGPSPRYDCNFNINTDAYTGADGTASAIGWAGNHQGVVTCLGGTFFVQDGINRNFGFGIYDGAPMTWADAGGYLPAQVTTFRISGATVSITEFADKGGAGRRFLRRRLQPGGRRQRHRPCRCGRSGPVGRLVALNTAPDTVTAHGSAVHDYVVAVDRFATTTRGPRRHVGQRRELRSALLPHEEFLERATGRIAAVSVPMHRSTTPTAADSSTPRSPAAGTT